MAQLVRRHATPPTSLRGSLSLEAIQVLTMAHLYVFFLSKMVSLTCFFNDSWWSSVGLILTHQHSNHSTPIWVWVNTYSRMGQHVYFCWRPCAESNGMGQNDSIDSTEDEHPIHLHQPFWYELHVPGFWMVLVHTWAMKNKPIPPHYTNWSIDYPQ